MKRFRILSLNASKARKVLDCASPLALLFAQLQFRKRQRTAAVQDADALTQCLIGSRVQCAKLVRGILVLLCAAAFAARAQSTAFTYQGRLAANGSPFTGFAEMQFALFSSPTGGAPIATSTPALASVNVSGGLFATSLDFGAAAFPGADRFLEIQVRTNIGAFTTLTPRQPVTPTPYALYARTAGTAGPWSANGSNAFYNAGNVGIGTTTPQASLDVRGDIRLGTNGQFRATSGEENLRIVRGSFLQNAIDNGSGFAVSHLGLGHYKVTFTTPFAGRPSVTAACDVAFGGGETPLSTFIDAVTVSSAEIYVFDPIRAQLGDGSFHFSAIGPR